MRASLSAFGTKRIFATLPTCLVGIEACPTAHYWSRRLQGLGHTVRLMPPSYVKAYVKRSKNDANDAAAICEVVTRPSMRFVATKSDAASQPAVSGLSANDAVERDPRDERWFDLHFFGQRLSFLESHLWNRVLR
jgi:hypothetical protein